MAKPISKSKAHKRKNQTKATTHAADTSEKELVLPKYPSPEAAMATESGSSQKLASGWKLFRRSLATLKLRPWLFAGIGGLYALMSLILVQSANGTLNVAGLQNVLQGSTNALTNGFLTLDWLLAGTGTAQSPSTTIYEVLLALVTGLAIVWALRQVLARNPIRIRDAFYKGMYPLIPVFIILVIIVIELIPMLLGLSAYNLLISLGTADQTWEQIVWALPLLALAIGSLLLMTPAIIGLYVATLPDMTPIESIKSATQLVKYRRWTVLRKLLFLPIILIVGLAVIVIPTLLLVPLLAPWFVFLLGIACLIIAHAYMYTLYRELLS